MMGTDRPTVVVAGAAGFVGEPLIRRLAGNYRLIALSRRARAPSEGIEWRDCDLLSSRDARAGVRGAGLAVYLVHSMAPSDHLVQGSFEDFDLQAADNFARACAEEGVSQIVYLGGLLPTGVAAADLSRHLHSRAEVERALAARAAHLTTLRAGLILGPGGSSTEIMLRMAKRLPVMICPGWTNTPTQPIALDDVLDLIEWVLGRAATFGQTYDIGGPEVLTYRELMLRAGDLLGRRPRTLSVPLITPRLSRLWITLVTRAPKELAAPLVQSLSHTMVAADRRLQEEAGVPGRDLSTAIAAALRHQAATPPRAFQRTPASGPPMVRSVQRFASGRMPPGRVAAEYFRWLPAALAPLIHVSGDPESNWAIHLFHRGGPVMLAFELDKTNSTNDRVVFDITSGLLAAPGSRGRFEFRAVLGDGTLLCSVHDFSPRLWWPIYVLTQANLHLLVMRAFARHLERPRPSVADQEACGRGGGR